MNAEAVVYAFAAALQRLESLTAVLDDEAAGGLEHIELEACLERDGRELLRQLMQHHLDPARDARAAGGGGATRIRGPHPGGPLITIFGNVQVTRLAYCARGAQNLYPGNAVLNVRPERHSPGLRRLAAVEAASGSVLGRGESQSTGSAAGRSGRR